MSDSNTITQNDFETFKLEIKKELSFIAERLENKIDKHLLAIKYWGIGGVILFCVIFSWLWDGKFDFINEKNQAHFEKLDAAVFTTRHDALLRAINNLQVQMMEKNQAKNNTEKKKKPKRH